MIRSLVAGACGLVLMLQQVTRLCAQTQPPDQQAPIAFEGGQLTITTQEADGDKVLAFDGQRLAGNHDVFFDRIVEVGGVKAALFEVGDGDSANLCGPPDVIVWKPQGGAIRSVTAEQDGCGSAVAVADDTIYFVPYLLPGEAKPSWQWSPTGGLTISGDLTYMPAPGTGWKEVDPSKYDNLIDAFYNEAVYRQAEIMLGKDMPVLAAGLLASDTEKTASGIFYASGCAPHDCGGNKGFMALDPVGQKLYFARSSAKPRMDVWPEVENWPADVKAALDKALGAPN